MGESQNNYRSTKAKHITEEYEKADVQGGLGAIAHGMRNETLASEQKNEDLFL